MPWPFARPSPPFSSFALHCGFAYTGGTSPVSNACEHFRQFTVAAAGSFALNCFSVISSTDAFHKHTQVSLQMFAIRDSLSFFSFSLINIPISREDGAPTTRRGRDQKATCRPAFTSQMVLEDPDSSTLRDSHSRQHLVNSLPYLQASRTNGITRVKLGAPRDTERGHRNADHWGGDP